MRPVTTLPSYLARTHLLVLLLLVSGVISLLLLVLAPLERHTREMGRQQIMTRERDILAERVNLLKRMVDVLEPGVPRPVLQRQILDIAQKTRFDDREYYFIVDATGKFLTTRDSTSWFLPGNARLGRDFFRKMHQQATNNSIYLEYDVQYDSRTGRQKKLSFILWLPEWQWYVGSGRMLAAINNRIVYHQGEIGNLFAVIRLLLWGTVILAGGLFLTRCLALTRAIRRDAAVLDQEMVAMEGRQPPDDRQARLRFREFDQVYRNFAKFHIRFINTLSNLEQMLDEKGILLKEIHHRTKNNFQIISCILSIQAERINDTAARNQLQRCEERIRMIGLIHEQIYNASDLTRVAFDEYIKSMMLLLSQRPQGRSGKILHDLQTGKILLPLEKAIPAGMIFSELVDNVYMHAFPAGAAGTITISLHGPDAERSGHELCVEDDGCGLPEGTAPLTATSIGFTLVRLLVSQLRGELAVGPGRGGRGARISLIF